LDQEIGITAEACPTRFIEPVAIDKAFEKGVPNAFAREGLADRQCILSL
jgi:hypothetical protein